MEMLGKLAVTTLLLATLAGVHAGDAPTLTYEQMARRPGEYASKPVCLSGEVVQVIEQAGDKRIVMRINITRSGDRYDHDPILALYDRNAPDEDRVLERDIVQICGAYTGLSAYDALFGRDVLVPTVLVFRLQIKGRER